MAISFVVMPVNNKVAHCSCRLERCVSIMSFDIEVTACAEFNIPRLRMSDNESAKGCLPDMIEQPNSPITSLVSLYQGILKDNVGRLKLDLLNMTFSSEIRNS